MKRCKGNCGRNLGLLNGDYCGECKEKLPLGEKFIEDLKRI